MAEPGLQNKFPRWKPTVRFNCLELLVRPIVRYCLSSGHSIQELVEVIKTSFVRVAEEELQKDLSEINLSRISVMTGLHRTEVARIRSAGGIPDSTSIGVLGRVIGQWEQDVRYQDKEGKPRALTYQGEKSEFFTLVKLVTKNVKPATVLFELERSGNVVRTEQGLKFARQLGGVEGDPVRSFSLLSRSLDALIRGSVQNIANLRKTANLHIHTEYDNLVASSLPTVERWLLDEGKVFHRQARDYLSKLDRDISTEVSAESEAGARVTVVAFSLTEEPERVPAAVVGTAKRRG